jgi:endonuclease/exonuclease/phosphatase family metal-dependent hydrolase
MKDWLKWLCRVVKELVAPQIEDNNTLNVLPSDYNINVMSFNIRRDCIKDGVNNWEFRKKAIVEMILDKSPDIICFQEVMPHMAKYLIANLAKYYSNSGVEIFTGREMAKSFFIWGEGLLVMFKTTNYSLIDKKVIKLFDGRALNFRRALHVSLYDNTNKKQVNVINTHFCHKSSEARKKSFEKLTQLYNDTACKFICGDFNCEAGSSVDGIDEFILMHNHNDIDKLGTINFFTGPCGKTIDFIFSDCLPLKTEVIREDQNVKFLSDHYPVLVSF